MASTGQGSTQAPQSMHSSGSMYTMRSSSAVMMQSTGHTSMHDLSLRSMQASVTTYVTALKSSEGRADGGSGASAVQRLADDPAHRRAGSLGDPGGRFG